MNSQVRRRRALLLATLAVPVVWWAIAAAGDPAPQAARPSPSASVGIPVETGSRDRPFAPNGCISFPPLQGEARGVVFLDAGHGGLDPGSQGRKINGQVVFEKTLTLGVVRAATEQLRAAGYQVVVSRTTDASVVVPRKGDVNGKLLTADGAYRVLHTLIACANDAKADVLISVHLNAFGDPSEGGAMTLYDPDRSFSAANLRLARIAHNSIISALRKAGWKGTDRSVLPDTAVGGSALTARGARYGHLILIGPRAAGFVPTPSAMPGVILEPLFITNPAEAEFASTIRGQSVLGGAIADAVDKWFAAK